MNFPIHCVDADGVVDPQREDNQKEEFGQEYSAVGVDSETLGIFECLTGAAAPVAGLPSTTAVAQQTCAKENEREEEVTQAENNSREHPHECVRDPSATGITVEVVPATPVIRLHIPADTFLEVTMDIFVGVDAFSLGNRCHSDQYDNSSNR